jgi:hypothetical protein
MVPHLPSRGLLSAASFTQAAKTIAASLIPLHNGINNFNSASNSSSQQLIHAALPTQSALTPSLLTQSLLTQVRCAGTARYLPYMAKANAHRLKQMRLNPGKRQDHFLEASAIPSIPDPLPDLRRPKRLDLSYYMNIQAGDKVQVLYGRDSGRQGVVRKLLRKKNCLIVHGMNMKKTFRVGSQHELARGERMMRTNRKL